MGMSVKVEAVDDGSTAFNLKGSDGVWNAVAPGRRVVGAHGAEAPAPSLLRRCSACWTASDGLLAASQRLVEGPRQLTFAELRHRSAAEVLVTFTCVLGPDHLVHLQPFQGISLSAETPLAGLADWLHEMWR